MVCVISVPVVPVNYAKNFSYRRRRKKREREKIETTIRKYLGQSGTARPFFAD